MTAILLVVLVALQAARLLLHARTRRITDETARRKYTGNNRP